jgi:hypothetical protein
MHNSSAMDPLQSLVFVEDLTETVIVRTMRIRVRHSKGKGKPVYRTRIVGDGCIAQKLTFSTSSGQDSFDVVYVDIVPSINTLDPVHELWRRKRREIRRKGRPGGHDLFYLRRCPANLSRHHFARYGREETVRREFDVGDGT